MSTKVVFKEEQTLGGKKLKELELREPLFKDMRLISKAGDELEMQNQIIRRLSGIDDITEDEFDNMQWSEYKKLSEAIEGLL